MGFTSSQTVVGQPQGRGGAWGSQSQSQTPGLAELWPRDQQRMEPCPRGAEGGGTVPRGAPSLTPADTRPQSVPCQPSAKEGS